MRGMGRFAVGALVVIALSSLAASPVAAAPRSGVSGLVRADGRQSIEATITFERAASGRLVRTIHTRGGRFHARLRAGRYRLRATADNGNGSASARVRVKRHHFTLVVLRLQSPSP
jgi:hypothetical protein